MPRKETTSGTTWLASKIQLSAADNSMSASDAGALIFEYANDEVEAERLLLKPIVEWARFQDRQTPVVKLAIKLYDERNAKK
jgi:hypothetical protein